MENHLTNEQIKILNSNKKNIVVSASAGSGKTFVVIEFLIKLICEKKIPLSRLLVLTFTKAAASEMRSRLYKAILKQKPSAFLLEQLDEISISDICTIDSYCEKLIKRNLNKLNLDENFTILDEKTSDNLKLKAFEKTFKDMAQKDEKTFQDIYFSFKKNKTQIFECVNSIFNYLTSLTEEEVKNIFCNFNFPLKAEEYLITYINSLKLEGLNTLSTLTQIPAEWQVFKNQLHTLFSFQCDDFWQTCNFFNKQIVPSLKRNKIDEKSKKLLVKAKKTLENIMEITENFRQVNDAFIKRFRENSLSNNILLMLKNFIENYESLKNKNDYLDFADLEKYTSKLLEDKNILNSLQNKYDYIFIDEYQDTNSLQEGLLKPLANEGHFVAVGDPKQGIYGFRNASMEIMNKDMKEFSSSSDGDALFLTGNFRSDKNILNFINKIFSVLMTEKTSNIDYKKTSLLEGLATFEKTDLPSVIVDVCVQQKEQDIDLPKVYSVREDKLSLNNKNLLEVKDIAYRIDEALNSEIFDSKLGQKRKVQESDIAVLFRSRSSLMKDCTKFLQEKGYNVLANIKDNLLDDSQIQIILSLLKLTINLKDDISLISVMSSQLGQFSYNELLNLKREENKYFYENIINSKSMKVLKFLNMIDSFKFDCDALGTCEALKKLFYQRDYYVYLNNLPDAISKKNNFNQLFKLIKNSFNFNIPSLINYLENVEVSSSTPPTSDNAITITTIHATKGLEYPVVILAGAGETLNKVYNKSFIIDKNFGIGTYIYDFSNYSKMVSPIFMAEKLIKKQKEKISELMIFYVALTRAQNSLIIIGSKTEKDIYDTEKDNYLSMISYALGKDFDFNDNTHNNKNYNFNIVKEIVFKNNNLLKQEKILKDKNITEILDYIDYEYNNKNLCKINFKNSVTGILNLNEESNYLTLNSSNNRDVSIEKGLAYHEALKLLDFDKISSMQDLNQQVEKNRSNFTEGYLELIDRNILLKNINILKKICKGKSIIKEHEFIMKISLDELFQVKSQNEVIIQGIIDLFSFDDEGILVDYKYTNIYDKNIIKNKYKKQLELYGIALSKAFGKKPKEVYILSLKNTELIKIDDIL